MGKQAFFAQRGTLKKGAMYKRLIEPLYASETRISREKDIDNLESFEMWLWKRMEKIDGRDKKSSEEGMQLTGRTAIADFEPSEKKERRNKRTKKRNWTGHVLREESLSGTEMEGSRPIRGK